MGHLEINAIKAEFAGKHSSLDKAIFERREIFVAGKLGRSRARWKIGAVDERVEIKNGMAGSNLLLFERIAAGVRQLQDRDKAVARSEFLLVRFAAGLEQLLQPLCGARMDPELARVGTAFRDHRAGFKPDQLRSARAKPAVAAESQFAGIAVRISVTTFHGMNRERISDSPGLAPESSDLDRLRENPANLLAILDQRKVDAQLRGVVAKVFEVFVVEILYGHFRSSCQKMSQRLPSYSWPASFE